VTYDLRGHRESAPATDGYSLERIAADALAVADAASLGEFVVVGFSMSAKVCQYVSVSAPDRVVGQILIRFGREAATIGRAALEGTLNTVMGTSFTDRLASLTTPSLVIGGSGDPMFPPDALRAAVVAPLAGARLARVDCGHEVPIEAPHELAALIEAFLAGLR
jgi:pimeloyl-ACP methyl ester carboxylesterase